MDGFPNTASHNFWAAGASSTRVDENPAQDMQLRPSPSSSEPPNPHVPMIGRGTTRANWAYPDQHTMNPSIWHVPPLLSQSTSLVHETNSPYPMPRQAAQISPTGSWSSTLGPGNINPLAWPPRSAGTQEPTPRLPLLSTEPGAPLPPQSSFSHRYPSASKSPSPGQAHHGIEAAAHVETISHMMPQVRRRTPPGSSRRSPGRSSIYDLLSAPSETSDDDAALRKMKSPEHTYPWVTPNLSLRGTRKSTYKIIVRQQPIAARACGNGEKDRRVIDPPPIVQLLIEDPSASKEEVQRRLRQNYTVHCTIWSESGREEVNQMTDDRTKKPLTGTHVACPFVGTDHLGKTGTFFCFPDLSVRTQGSYRLKFAIVVMASEINRSPGARLPVVGKVMSEPFKVYPPKDFPGMSPSTALTKTLRSQGCIVSLRKGVGRPTKNRGGNDNRDAEIGEDEDEDDDADEDADMEVELGPPPKRARKAKN